jgi:Dockerin type I domain
MRLPVGACILALFMHCNTVVGASPNSKQWNDTQGDEKIRETGVVGFGQFNNLALPDIRSLKLTAWQATDPVNDPYTGVEVDPATANLVRFDIVLTGLVNPPGPLALGASPFDPYMFGNRPVYGFFEFNLDGVDNSGGELENVAKFRYLANAARFGGLPTGTIGDRAAKSAFDYDGFFFSGPQFERSGAELTLILCGCFTPALVSETGNGDGLFDAGETMIVRGRFLERFVSIAPFSGVFGGSDFGLYDPEVNLRFDHDVSSDTTTVTLVYALNAQGAADLTGQPVQPLDNLLINHTSIAEMLRDIVLTSSGCCGPIFNDPVVIVLAQDWISPSFPDVAAIEQEITQYLNPTQWTASGIVGTAYSTQQSALYVWTDVGYAWRFADMTQDGIVDSADETALTAALNALDGGPQDADGTVNGVVSLINFGPNFCLYDLNYDGAVDTADATVISTIRPADLNGDGVVDSIDLATVLANWGPCAGCASDLNSDGVIDSIDLANVLADWG